MKSPNDFALQGACARKSRCSISFMLKCTTSESVQVDLIQMLCNFGRRSTLGLAFKCEQLGLDDFCGAKALLRGAFAPPKPRGPWAGTLCVACPFVLSRRRRVAAAPPPSSPPVSRCCFAAPRAPFKTSKGALGRPRGHAWCWLRRACEHL